MNDTIKTIMKLAHTATKEVITSASTQTKVCAGLTSGALVTRCLSKVVAKTTKDERKKEVAEGMSIISGGLAAGALGATVVSTYGDICCNRLEALMAEERSALIDSVQTEARKMAEEVKAKGTKLSRKEVKAAAELVRVLVEESTEEPELAELIAKSFAEELKRK